MTSPVDFILNRVSQPKLTAPAPSAEQLELLFAAADRAPDHKQLKPWRFYTVQNEQLNNFADKMIEAQRLLGEELGVADIEAQRTRLHRAPMMIMATAKLVEDTNVPELEQLLAAGAAVQNLVLAADVMGLGVIWRTGSLSHSQELHRVLNLPRDEKIIGFLYIGTPKGIRKNIRRAPKDAFTFEWKAS